ncbi:MAG: family 43 glycosylhydrolase [Anaerohalosphaeraceae bacterium]
MKQPAISAASLQILLLPPLFLLLIWPSLSCADVPDREPVMLELEGDLNVHDPVLIKEKDTYYLFCTGGNRRTGYVPIRCSKDLRHWQLRGYVFETLPEWAPIEIPGTRGVWAPDISHFNGRYHLYYSISTFGKNNSAIGLATNKTLDPNSPDYRWEDHGMVIRSTEGKDDWNAIDANIVIEDEKNIWICWGSFWSGIQMRKIDPATGKLSAEHTAHYTLASRPRKAGHTTPPVEGAVEAPFIVRRNGFWYLFVSFDLCCRGTESTYNIVVGRAEKVTGPYCDREGVPMLEGGGTQVIKATTENWKGPGHCAVFREGDQDYLVFHAYHGQTGRPYLKISTMEWKDGWPVVAPLP